MTLDRLMTRLHRRKADLLRVLQRPDIPLHINGSENDIRACVIKRKISGGTMSSSGRTAREVMLGLMKTCAKLRISFFRYLGDRLCVPGLDAVPPLADRVRQASTVRRPANLPRLPIKGHKGLNDLGDRSKLRRSSSTIAGGSIRMRTGGRHELCG